MTRGLIACLHRALPAFVVLTLASPSPPPARAATDSPPPLPVRAATDSLSPPPVRAATDSLSVRFEIGASSSASNEQFYESAYTDTTFLGRRLHNTPESWVAGVAALDLAGAAGAGRWQFALHPEVTLGDVVARAGATGSLRFRPDARWQLALDPRLELARDRSFDVDRREAVAGGTLRARRHLAGEPDALDLRVGGEWLATPGSQDPYLLAHRTGRIGVGWSHDGLLGASWAARYDANLRTFPDSTERDHVEHAVALDLRGDFAGGHSAALDVELIRRATLYAVAGSRDRFVEAHAELRGNLRFGERTALLGVLAAEGHRFDQPDSTLDFDYGVTQAELELRREFAGGWSVAIGPRAEWLAAPWNEAERYAEAAGALSFESLGLSHWWQLEPAAGWRGYARSEAGQSTDPAALHSSYSFVELQCLGEQSLPARLRLRLVLDARAERHQDPTQDAHSLYFSLDLRRLY